MPKLDAHRRECGVARNFQPLSKTEMERISGSLATKKAELDRFFSTHVDA